MLKDNNRFVFKDSLRWHYLLVAATFMERYFDAAPMGWLASQPDNQYGWELRSAVRGDEFAESPLRFFILYYFALLEASGADPRRDGKPIRDWLSLVLSANKADLVRKRLEGRIPNWVRRSMGAMTDDSYQSEWEDRLVGINFILEKIGLEPREGPNFSGPSGPQGGSGGGGSASKPLSPQSQAFFVVVDIAEQLLDDDGAGISPKDGDAALARVLSRYRDDGGDPEALRRALAAEVKTASGNAGMPRELRSVFRSVLEPAPQPTWITQLLRWLTPGRSAALAMAIGIACLTVLWAPWSPSTPGSGQDGVILRGADDWALLVGERFVRRGDPEATWNPLSTPLRVYHRRRPDERVERWWAGILYETGEWRYLDEGPIEPCPDEWCQQLGIQRHKSLGAGKAKVIVLFGKGGLSRSDVERIAREGDPGDNVTAARISVRVQPKP